MPPGVIPSCCLFTFWENWGVEGGVGPQATSRKGFPETWVRYLGYKDPLKKEMASQCKWA